MIRRIEPYFCRKCGKDLRGPKIPKKEQKYFGTDYFGAELASYDLERDRIGEWMCPFCNTTAKTRLELIRLRNAGSP